MSRIIHPAQKIVRPFPGLWFPGMPIPGAMGFGQGWPCPNCCGCLSCNLCSGTPSDSSCCVEVDFTGITDNGCGVTCLVLNGPIFPITKLEAENCVWVGRTSLNAAECAPRNMRVDLRLDGSDYKVRVELLNDSATVEHRWEKNLGTSKPSCFDNIIAAIPNTLSSGACDSSSSTSRVFFTDGPQETPCQCDQCEAKTQRDEVEVTVSGWTDAPSDPCDNCDSINDVYVLTRLTAGGAIVGFYAPCVWHIEIAGNPCGLTDIYYRVSGTLGRILLHFDNSDFSTKTVVYDKNLGGSLPDCDVDGDLDGTYAWLNGGFPDINGCLGDDTVPTQVDLVVL